MSEVLVTFDIPMAIFGAIGGVIIMLINLKVNSALLWLAASVCFIGVYFDENLTDSIYRIVAGILIAACWIIGFFGWRKKRYG